MNKNRIKTLVVALSLFAILLSTQAAYAVPVDRNLLIDTNGTDGWTLQVHGSSTVIPITNDAIPDFESANSGVDVITTGPGSGTGYSMLVAGTTDIAAMSKLPSFGDIADIRLWVIGMDSVAIIVPAGNTWLTNAASASLIADIFRSTSSTSGTPYYTYWDDVPGLTGAPHQLIKRYTRDMDDGTHDCFNTFFMKAYGYDTGATNPGNWLPTSNTRVGTNQQMVSLVSTDPYAIGYVGMGFLADEESILNGISINGVYPSISSVLDNTYKAQTGGSTIRRFLWYITNGIPDKNSNGALKSEFISYVRTDSIYVTLNGYIPILQGDFTSSTTTQITTFTDSLGPAHPLLPDYRVNFDDILYFVDAYIAAGGSSGLANPYADFDADLDVDFDDILAFVDEYIASPH